jgi:hypothetical protein
MSNPSAESLVLSQLAAAAAAASPITTPTNATNTNKLNGSNSTNNNTSSTSNTSTTTQTPTNGSNNDNSGNNSNRVTISTRSNGVVTVDLHNDGIAIDDDGEGQHEHEELLADNDNNDTSTPLTPRSAAANRHHRNGSNGMMTMTGRQRSRTADAQNDFLITMTEYRMSATSVAMWIVIVFFAMWKLGAPWTGPIARSNRLTLGPNSIHCNAGWTFSPTNVSCGVFIYTTSLPHTNDRSFL